MRYLQIDHNIMANALQGLNISGKIVIENLNDGIKDSIQNNQAIYLSKFYFSEKRIADRIKLLISTPKALCPVEVEKAVAWVQRELSIQLAQNQLEAIRNAIENKVLILTGGPGTGKTTVINAILKIFNAMGARCLLAAPTGRAAKRMSEATGIPAKTLHRLLEFSFQNGGFQKNEEKPLNCHALIVDEASMIDTVLMHHLIKAVPPTASFILVGDINQLPSVGPGNVLKDMISSGSVPVTKLTQIFRQAAESLIIVNAHRINQGDFPLLPSNDHSKSLHDFYFIRQEDPEKVLNTILNLTCNVFRNVLDLILLTKYRY
jgi:exodeoxyribonuclease V alpha subunit